jgi:hypothetical protein
MSVSALPARNIDHSPESLADRIRRLRTEAESAARDHAGMLLRAILEVEAIASDIAEGGESYAPGVRETARRLGPELETARLNVEALLGR